MWISRITHSYKSYLSGNTNSRVGWNSSTRLKTWTNKTWQSSIKSVSFSSSHFLFLFALSRSKNKSNHSGDNPCPFCTFFSPFKISNNLGKKNANIYLFKWVCLCRFEPNVSAIYAELTKNIGFIFFFIFFLQFKPLFKQRETERLIFCYWSLMREKKMLLFFLSFLLVRYSVYSSVIWQSVSVTVSVFCYVFHFRNFW